MPDIVSTITSGVYARFFRRGAVSTDSSDQYVIPVRDRITSYKGRANTFRIPGIAGTTGQKLLSLHNASGSDVIVDVESVRVDLAVTTAKAVTVLPPLIRVHKVTVLPTGGATLPKVPEDSLLVTSSSVTLLQGGSADGTAATLVATIPVSNIVTQEFAPRLITAAGYEPFDRSTYLEGAPFTLRPLEGIVVELVYVLATQNPVTDMWALGINWSEYTRPT